MCSAIPLLRFPSPHGAADSSPARTKAMQTEAKASLVGGLGTVPAHLGSLSVDQDPDDLCKLPGLPLRSVTYTRCTFPPVRRMDQGRRFRWRYSTICAHKTVSFRGMALNITVQQWAKSLLASHIIPEAPIKTTRYPVAHGGIRRCLGWYTTGNR